jgi:glyoxylase-like metal-dependent hydrolase (beta-lactamase superfamily II)
MTVHRVAAGPANCYLIRERGTILVDAGAPGKAAALLARLATLLPGLGEVGLIVATHGHFDHIGAAGEARAASRAPLALHRADLEWARQATLHLPPGVTPWGKVLATLGRRVILPLLRTRLELHAIEPDLLLDDAGLDLEPFGVAGRVVATPGHTAGSVSVVLADGGVVAGDLVMNDLPFCVRPCLAIFAVDADLLRESWRTVRRSGATTLYPGHGRPFPARAIQEPG